MNGGPSGDLYVVVNLKPHPVFQREGADLHCEMPISFADRGARRRDRDSDARRPRQDQDPGGDADRAGVPPAQQGHPAGARLGARAISSATSRSRRRSSSPRGRRSSCANSKRSTQTIPSAHNPRAKIWFMDKVRISSVRNSSSAYAASTRYDVVVIGAGAAGMMCAAQAGQRGRRVLLIEHYHKLGEKIRISGGGRCNFTNTDASPRTILSRNPDFCRSALARYTPRDFIALVERHGIAYHEKKLGQLFCDDSAQDIIAMLQGRVRPRAASSGGCRAPSRASSASTARSSSTTARGHGARGSLVIATGGLTGAEDRRDAVRLQGRRAVRLDVVPPRPALVPLAFAPNGWRATAISSGVALDVEVVVQRRTLSREPALHASRTLGSGDPADLVVLGRQGVACHRPPARSRAPRAWFRDQRASTRAARQRAGAAAAAAVRRQRGAPRTTLRGPMRRLVDRALRGRSSRALHRWQVQPAGTLGYNKAEVTLGGVDTRELSSKTMAATRVPGLYFIGEVVDVTGWLGGYNFQWAWSVGSRRSRGSLRSRESTVLTLRSVPASPREESRLGSRKEAPVRTGAGAFAFHTGRFHHECVLTHHAVRRRRRIGRRRPRRPPSRRRSSRSASPRR